MLRHQSKTTSWNSTILENYVKPEAIPWIKSEIADLPSLFQKSARLWMSIILLATDLLDLTVALLVASYIHLMPFILMDARHDGIFVLLAVMLAVLFLRKGLYPAVGVNYVDELRYLVSSSVMAFLSMIAVTFVFQIAFLAPVLAVAGAITLFLNPIGRYFVRRMFIQWNLWGEPVAIIGDSDKAQALVAYFTLNRQFGIRPVAVLSDPILIAGDQWLCPSLQICRLKLFVRDLSLKTVLVLIDDLNDIDRLVERYRFIFPRVILMRDQTQKYGLNNLRPLDFTNMLGLQVSNNLLKVSSQISKRIVDLLVAFVAILILSPLLALIALLIKLDTGGRVFYRQLRVGKNGQSFTLVKFRTMHLGADQVLQEALSRDPALKKEWDSFQKLKNDPRITRVGKLLRRFSLDELPQLYNILRGEMSIIGPRPIMVTQRKLYGDSMRLYIRVRPGMTGLWQVSGRNETTFSQRAMLDIEYIQRWSHWLDIYILFKTIKVVFWQKGAY